MPGQDDDDDIVRRLRAYVLAHPLSGDSVAGITVYWLGLAPNDANIAAVQRALQLLKREGSVRSRPFQQGRLWFAARDE